MDARVCHLPAETRVRSVADLSQSWHRNFADGIKRERVCEMGLHLPLVGYFKARGRLKVRENRRSKYNRDNDAKLLLFFQRVIDAHNRGIDQHTPIWQRDHNNNVFSEIMFEKSDDGRAELSRFLRMPRPKTLVITTLGDLYEDTVANGVVAEFTAQAAAEPPIFPVLCLDQVDYPLTPNRLEAMDDENFVRHLWGNEMRMREMFLDRRAQINRAA